MRKVLIDKDLWPKRIVAEIDDDELPLGGKQLCVALNFLAGTNRYRIADIDSPAEVTGEMLAMWREGITGQDIVDTMPPKPGESG